MERLDYTATSSDLIIYFGGEQERISALTLSETLAELVRVIEIVNDEIAPGSALLLNVTQTRTGSFKIGLTGERRELLKNLWAPAIMIGTNVLTGVLIYQLTVAQESREPTIQIIGDVTVIQGAGYEMLLPRDAADQIGRLVTNEELQARLKKSFRALERDEKVTSFGLSTKIDEVPEVLINRADFKNLAADASEEVGTREVLRDVEVTILKAVFERGARKWQFILEGERVSAAISDSKFFDQLSDRSIVLGDGDTLVVTLSTVQEWNDVVSVWVNKKHTVIKVHEHHPRTDPQRDFIRDYVDPEGH